MLTSNVIIVEIVTFLTLSFHKILFHALKSNIFETFSLNYTFSRIVVPDYYYYYWSSVKCQPSNSAIFLSVYALTNNAYGETVVIFGSLCFILFVHTCHVCVVS